MAGGRGATSGALRIEPALASIRFQISLYVVSIQHHANFDVYPISPLFGLDTAAAFALNLDLTCILASAYCINLHLDKMISLYLAYN